MKALLLWMIRFYRREISPLRPPCCRFIPTCSQYALEAVEKYGAWRGGWLALRRVLRCNPFHRQKSIQYDPVPSWRSGTNSTMWRYHCGYFSNAFCPAFEVLL